ncbi:MAG: glucuronate isomerase [Solirubrobacteraceae bacterium]
MLPADPAERAIARRICQTVRDLPVISPHGHVDPRVLIEDQPFPDPATLLVTPDHHVTRLLHADRVGLEELGVGQGPLSEDASRQAWRILYERWPIYRGTPVRLWLEAELGDIFGVTSRPSAQTAVRMVFDSTGRDDRCPVISEPVHEWVLSGAFPAERPRWEDAGATFTDDVTPFPVLRAERAAGRPPPGATRTLAAWVSHLRGPGAPISDARADELVGLAAGRLTDAVPRVLGRLDPDLGTDADVVAAVVEETEQLERPGRRRRA